MWSAASVSRALRCTGLINRRPHRQRKRPPCLQPYRPNECRTRPGNDHACNRTGRMNAERDQAMTGDFEPEQKRYLEGFVAGLQIARTASNIAGRSGAGPAGAGAASEPTGPDAPHWRGPDPVSEDWG